MPKDVRGVMHEFKHGELHSGSKTGPKVTKRKQAIAIALSEQRQLEGKSSKGRSKSKPRRRGDAGRFDGPPAAPGMGSFDRQPVVRNNPPSFAGRRAAARNAANL